MAVTLNDVQREQAAEVGRCLRTHVDSIQRTLLTCVKQDADGRVVATAPLPLNGDEMLAVQGLLTMFKTLDGVFGGGS